MNLSLGDLNTVITRTMRLAEHKAEMSGVLFRWTWTANLPPIHCDAAQMEQVALAMAINAIDAMPHGGNLWVSTRTLPGGGSKSNCRYATTALASRRKFCRRFSIPSPRPKKWARELGLGLAVSKGIVERHGGHIEVSSELGVGTTFRDHRACVCGASRRRTCAGFIGQLSAGAQGRGSRNVSENKSRLLIVDDELSVRDSLNKWFREEGYEVGTAENASEALLRLAEHPWDIALLDIKMRGTDGIELQRRIHELDPNLIVIMMTGYASVETAVAALKNGAYDYVTKPLDPDEIAHLMQNALSHRHGA